MNEFVRILPEIILALTLAFVIIGEITYHGEEVRLIIITSLLGLSGAFLQTIISYQFGASQIFSQTLAIDGLSLFFKLIFIMLAGFSIAGCGHSAEIPKERRTEYCALILASCLAMSLASSASDLLLAFLSLQFLNVLGYFLAGYGKRSMLSTEASVKYLVFSVVAGALMLYGMAILFGSTQSLNIYTIHSALVQAPLAREMMLVVFVTMLMSLSFQIGAFPMYLWTPDVLQGSPTPVSSFLSVGTRAAGFAVALRFFIVMFASPSATDGQWQVLGQINWPEILALSSGLTMVIGALLAFRQTSAKRMVGCLVVAQSGYLLLGLLVLDQVGVAALLYNLVVELFSLVGIFYILSFIFDQLGTDSLPQMKGLLRRAVPECICLILFLLCLVGLPPMPGFIGKFTLIGVAIRHQWPVLGIAAIFSVAISTMAIARFAYDLIGEYASETSASTAEISVQPNLSRTLYLVVLMLPLLFVGVFANDVLRWAGNSLGFILW